jgi:hypothetical protein
MVILRVPIYIVEIFAGILWISAPVIAIGLAIHDNKGE